jgi:hypothetical protein
MELYESFASATKMTNCVIFSHVSLVDIFCLCTDSLGVKMACVTAAIKEGDAWMRSPLDLISCPGVDVEKSSDLEDKEN